MLDGLIPPRMLAWSGIPMSEQSEQTERTESPVESIHCKDCVDRQCQHSGVDDRTEDDYEYYDDDDNGDYDYRDGSYD